MPTLQLNRLSLGIAGTAPQIEGGRVDHSWMDWADRGHIRDGSSPARANDHYRRFSEDAALMESLGIRDYRFGVEWARIEPGPTNSTIRRSYNTARSCSASGARHPPAADAASLYKPHVV